MSLRLSIIGLLAATLAVSAQQGGDEQMPRFRAGANLVRVDAYFTKDGVAVTDLKPEELVVFEDDRPQKIESVELIKPRAAVPSSQRVDPTNMNDMKEQVASSARLFTFFLDTGHVTIGGAYHANKPIVDTLDNLVGPDDMFGVMTPEMSPQNVTYGRRTSSIERYLQETWAWGRKGQIASDTPHEADIKLCYADPKYKNTAAQMIARLREQQTLDALDQLVSHLDGLRPERKFVVIFTEGWPLFQRDDNLARVFDNQVPGRDTISVDPGTGRPTTRSPQNSLNTSTSFESCERERVMLAYIDHQITFRELLQRANRANVSFYPVDARGLIVFDSDMSAPLPPALDAAVLKNRWDNLRDMASATDGAAILDTNKITEAMQKMFADTGAYYLLRYYSSNSKLDGRFRRIGVQVKRPGVDVRARAGYLAPTEQEARAAGVTTPKPTGSGSRSGVMTPPAAAPSTTVTRALDAIVPSRGNLPVRIQASGGQGLVRAVVELDAATLKLPEWLSGGNLKLVIEPERGNTAGQSYTVESPIEPGQRSSITMTAAETPIPPGRYSVRAELKPRMPHAPIQVTTFVTVPPANAEVGMGLLAMRRGPSTGLAYVPTADPRFRRTERLRLEVPLMGEGFTPKGRMLTREGQPMPLIVTYTTRMDEARGVKFGVAEVVLAPLAEGEYVVEVDLEKNGKTETVSYGFRLIPG